VLCLSNLDRINYLAVLRLIAQVKNQLAVLGLIVGCNVAPKEGLPFSISWGKQVVAQQQVCRPPHTILPQN
jgi:hypothetical protein